MAESHMKEITIKQDLKEEQIKDKKVLETDNKLVIVKNPMIKIVNKNKQNNHKHHNNKNNKRKQKEKKNSKILQRRD